MKITELTNDFNPVELFLHASGARYPFFLDGGGTSRFCQSSMIGCDPFLVMQGFGRKITLTYPRLNRVEVLDQNPFVVLDELINRFKTTSLGPFPMAPGGAVGYLSYDLFTQVEKLERTAVDDLGMPDIFFAFYDSVVYYDLKTGKSFLAHNPKDEYGESDPECFWQNIQKPQIPELKDYPGATLTPNQTPEEFMAAVQKAREHIAAGDVYQVNLSQRFTADYPGTPIEFYLKLRNTSPAPFSACLFPDNFAVLSNSPERYLLIDGDYIETRPIKGTRPRGKTVEEDERLKNELLASEKDNAEHVMIVDLERNDLGRVCMYNSVHVPEFRVIESYANVHHMVSTVAGRVHPQKSLVDCIRNSFPGGSITGAPKVWAMRIIDQLEPTARGVYCGSVGYLDFSGHVDLNIAIRTAVQKGQKLYFQVGGGIVMDSDPKDEYDETITKAQSFLKALTGLGHTWDE